LKKLSGSSQKNNFHRVIDANLNRVKEGLRVTEEVARFIIDDRKLSSDLKKIRHEVDELAEKFFEKSVLLKERKSRFDVGRSNSNGELNRSSYKDIFWANTQRVKESFRVLEEFSKLLNVKAALGFKELRYRLYEIEKNSFKKIAPLPDPRRAGSK